MVAGAAISTDLSDAEWLKALRGIGEKGGYFSSLGDKHAAVFIEQSHSVKSISRSGSREQKEFNRKNNFNCKFDGKFPIVNSES